MYFACSGSWRGYTLESIGDCNGYIFTDAETSCPHSEVQWNWSYWSGELGDSFAAKCLGPAGHPNFCTVDNPCPENEGDCDMHSECQADTKCGSNNCPSFQGFPFWVDCCYAGTGLECWCEKIEVYHEDGFTDVIDFAGGAYANFFGTYTKQTDTANDFSAYKADVGTRGIWYSGSYWVIGSWSDVGGGSGNAFNSGGSNC